MVNGRNKGRAAEQEIVRILNRWHGDMGRDGEGFSRNLNQSRDGGWDIATDYPLAIEIKRAENLMLSAWWQQAREQAEGTNRVPVLIYRRNRMGWRVRLEQRLCLRCGDTTTELVDISLEAFGRMLCSMIKAWRRT